MSRRRNFRDTIIGSAGWLFADLLLALTMLFLAANTLAIKPPPPTLTTAPMSLEPKSSHCTGPFTAPRCTVMVSETVSSQGNVTWTASSDIGNIVSFSPAKGTLSPGKSVTVTISAIPCQNGSFTFSGSRGANPATVLWRCTPLPTRLDFNFQNFILHNVDYNGLLNNSQQAINNVKAQVKNVSFLHGRSVGLAIVYGGAPSDGDIARAQTIATKIYSILKSLGKEKDGVAFQNASYYVPLYALGNDPSIVSVDVYLFKK